MDNMKVNPIELPPDIVAMLLHPEAQARLIMYLKGAGDTATYALQLNLIKQDTLPLEKGAKNNEDA
jgi:hypothetical protein